jgi:hypothetical protein
MKWIFVLVIMLSSAALYPLQIAAQKQFVESTNTAQLGSKTTSSQTKKYRSPVPQPKLPRNIRPVIKRPNGLAAASISPPNSSPKP